MLEKLQERLVFGAIVSSIYAVVYFISYLY